MPVRPIDAHVVHAQLRLAVYHVACTSYRKLRAEIEHPHWAISHVAAGEVRMVNQTETLPVPRGSVMIHPPGRPYAEYAEHEGTHEWMIHRRVTRAQLAREAHLQPNYLDRAFRSAYGLAPMRMLRRLRMPRARHLLESTDETVETIAADCGFGEASYLTRAFRHEYGEAPGRYCKGVKSARTRYAAP